MAGNRIAVITTSYPSHDHDPAGHFVRSECQILAGAGYDVHVIAPVSSTCRASFVDKDVSVWPIAHAGAFGWPGAAARIRVAPWKITGAFFFAAEAVVRLRRLRPDRIIAHWIVPSAFPIVSCCRPSDLEVVAHGADVRLLLALPLAVRVCVVSEVLSRASSVRFAAEAGLLSLMNSLPRDLANGLKSVSKVVLPAVEVCDVSEAAASIRNAYCSSALIVTVSRLVRSKRVDIAIDAIGRLGMSAELVIVGDGPDRGRLESLSSGKCVKFVGFVPRKEALAWISAADVLVHVSEKEAAPSVIREARLLGTPVVACAVGDVLRWAEADCGIVVAGTDPSEVAASVTRVLRLAKGSGGLC